MELLKYFVIAYLSLGAGVSLFMFFCLMTDPILNRNLDRHTLLLAVVTGVFTWPFELYNIGKGLWKAWK